jgi:hypothetical protein
MRTEIETIYLFGDATTTDSYFVDKYNRKIYYSQYELRLGGYTFYIVTTTNPTEPFFCFGCQEISTNDFLTEYALFKQPKQVDGIYLKNRKTSSGILKEKAGKYYISEDNKAFLESEHVIKQMTLQSNLVHKGNSIKYKSFSLTKGGLTAKDVLERLEILAEIATFLETPPNV